MADGAGIGAGSGASAGGPVRGFAPTRSGSGGGLGASVGVEGQEPPVRQFTADAGWNNLQVAWFHDTPNGLWQTRRTRSALRKLVSRVG